MAIDGLVSGLNTAEIIESLMAIERLPQDAMVARQTKAKNQLDAYKSVRDKIAALGTAASNLATASKWNARTATSSNPATATVSSTATGSLGSLTFTVDQLAASHGLRSANTSPTTDTVIASSGTISVDLGDGEGPQSIAVGGGTLAEVASALNKAGLGLRAATVNTGSGFHLQVDSTATGAAAAFTLGGLDPAVGGTLVTSQGQDAKLTIGTGPGAYAVTSRSNTFSDLIPGVSITAVAVSTTAVTTTVTENVAALADSVKALVDAANAALSEISLRTSYDAKNKTGATLNGDASVRRAAQEITRAITEMVGSSDVGSAGLAGVKLERTGRFSFDSAAFTTAYDKNPAGVRNLFVQSGATTDPNVSFVSAGGRALTGTYAIEVTTAAEQATATGLTGGWPLGVDTEVGIRIGATDVSYTIGAGMSAADAAAGLQAAASAAGLRVDIAESGGGLSITTADYGTSANFEVAWDGVTYATHAGVDVAGTIDGVAAVGKGQQLQVPTTDTRLGGLAVLVTGSATGPLGTVDYGAGIAQRLASAVSRSNDLVDGYLTTAEKGKQTRIDTLTTSISDYDRRLDAREARLRTYWAALEVSLGKLKDQSSWLAGQISSLSTGAS